MVLKILRSRKFARRVLLALLILIIPAFILWGAGNVTRGPELIGKIGSQKIYPVDFAKSRRGIQAQLLFMYYGNVDALNQMLRNRPMLNVMAWERLVLLSEARKRNINVSNEEVLAFLTQHPLFKRDGVFDQNVYTYILRNNLSIEPRQFEELVRENLEVHALRNLLLEGVEVTDEEILEYYKKTNDKVELSYIIIEADSFTEGTEVTPGEVEAYYEENKNTFFDPVKIEVEYMALPYNDASEKALTVRKLEKVYPEVRQAPDKFIELADKYEIRTGKTDPFSREDVVPGVPFFKEFYESAFSLDKGEVSLPLFSGDEKGSAYVLKKISEIPPRAQSFEEVQEKILVSLTKEKRLKLADKKAADTFVSISKMYTTLENEAASLGKEVKQTGAIDITGYIEGVGPAGDIVVRSRQVNEGKMLSPIVVKDKVLLARVDKLIPADEAGLEDKKDIIQKNLLFRKQVKALEDWFKENSSKVEVKRRLEEL